MVVLFQPENLPLAAHVTGVQSTQRRRQASRGGGRGQGGLPLQKNCPPHGEAYNLSFVCIPRWNGRIPPLSEQIFSAQVISASSQKQWRSNEAGRVGKAMGPRIWHLLARNRVV